MWKLACRRHATTESYEQRVGSAVRYQLRRLKSEYGIIRVSGDVEWLGFREVQIVDGKPLFGMPGNPTSCLTNAYLLVAPVLRRMAHLLPATERVVLARLASEVESPAGRHQIYPVRLEGVAAIPVFKGSGEITSLAHADGYFEIPAEVERVGAETVVEVTLF